MTGEPFQELAELLSREIPVSVPPFDMPYIDDGELDWVTIDGKVGLLAADGGAHR